MTVGVVTCRIGVDVDSAAVPLTLARTLLVADVLARVRAVLHGEDVRCAAAPAPGRASPGAGVDVGRPDGLRWAETPDRVAGMLGGRPDIVVSCAGAAAGAGPRPSARRTVRVGPVTSAGPVVPAAGDEHARNALRLAMLRFPAGRPAALTLPRRHRADQTLDRWRLKVAMWADMPPAPPPQPAADAAALALDEALDQVTDTGPDTPSALIALHRLEADLTVPSGAKYVVFAHADRMLGLDLGHLVGRLRR